MNAELARERSLHGISHSESKELNEIWHLICAQADKGEFATMLPQRIINPNVILYLRQNGFVYDNATGELRWDII